MKRSEEVSIILQSLIKSGTVSGLQKEAASKAIKAAMKEIRTMQSTERKKNKDAWRYKVMKEKKKCPTCGREVKEFWNYCTKCGSYLRIESQSASKPQTYNTDFLFHNTGSNNTDQEDQRTPLNFC